MHGKDLGRFFRGDGKDSLIEEAVDVDVGGRFELEEL